MPPRFKLNSDQKLWIGEIVKGYEKGVLPNDTEILLKIHESISSDFEIRKIDDRLFNNNELNIYGIYCYESRHEILSEINKIILQARDRIKRFRTPVQIYARDVETSLKINETRAKLCLKLISHVHGLYDGATGPIIGFGYDSINISRVDTIRNYLEYTDINFALNLIFKRKTHNFPSAKFQKPAVQLGQAIQKSVVPNSAFILMWIDNDNPEQEDLLLAIKSTFEKFKINAVRSDEIEHEGRISEIVLKSIRESEFIFADLTGERPNVYYEIGYAHAIEKRAILYRKQKTKVHFDLADYNIPEYKNLTDLKKKLEKKLEFIIGKKAG